MAIEDVLGAMFGMILFLIILVGFLLYQFLDFKHNEGKQLIKNIKKDLKGILPTKKEKQGLIQMKKSIEKDITTIFQKNPAVFEEFGNVSQTLSNNPSSGTFLGQDMINMLMQYLMKSEGGNPLSQFMRPEALLIPAAGVVFKKLKDRYDNKTDPKEDVIPPFKDKVKNISNEF